MGWTTAVLKAAGTWPEASDRFTRCAMGDANVSTPFLRMETGMSSKPRASVDFRPAMVLVIRPALAKPKWNGFFDLGQVDEVGGTVESFDDTAARTTTGLIDVFQIDAGAFGSMSLRV